MIGKSISLNSLILGAFALCTAGVVALTYEATAERIADAKRRAAQAALAEIIPSDQHDNDLFSDTQPVLEDFREFLGLTSDADKDKVVHIARQQHQPVAAIIPSVALDGYSGAIKMIVGVYQDGTIAGIRVTDHNETPGLGDYIDVKKSNWILSFNGKDISSDFDRNQEINKQTGEAFDQLTGATITRKAVIRQVKKTLSYYQIASPLDQTPLAGSP